LRSADEERPFAASAEACKAWADRLVCGESRKSQNGNFTAPGAGKLASGRWARRTV
jgi:hypothetical protein